MLSLRGATRQVYKKINDADVVLKVDIATENQKHEKSAEIGMFIFLTAYCLPTVSANRR